MCRHAPVHLVYGCAPGEAACSPTAAPMLRGRVAAGAASGFFSREPLNSETLARRATRASRSGQVSPQLVLDYVHATRQLQHVQRTCNAGLGLGVGPGRPPRAQFGISVAVSNAELERRMWTFLHRYWRIAAVSSEVVEATFSAAPAFDVSNAFQLVKENFDASIQDRKYRLSLLSKFIRVLLKSGDFHNCIKLIDLTVGNHNLIAYMRKRLLSQAFLTSLGLVISVAVFGIVPGALTAVSLFCTQYITTKFVYGFGADRVSWRPHTSLLYRYLHCHELFFLNRIVSYFEEVHETNARNFHISKVRTLPPPENGDFEIVEEPGEKDVLKLAFYFRKSLHRRRMVWNALHEEKMFLEFWVSHGEGFEWVEPDQDPATNTLQSIQPVPTSFGDIGPGCVTKRG